MKNFVIEIRSQTASFRNPTFQNYHKSLELPPPTTIVGLAGAAMGLSPFQAQEFFTNSNIRIGISGNYEGKCQDTWKYLKSAVGMRHYDPIKDASIIQKEYLIANNFYLAFLSENVEAIRTLVESFQNPVYALTMGNSDSLAKVVTIVEDLDVVHYNRIEHAYVMGNVVSEVTSLAAKGKLEFSIYSNDSLIYDLPIQFEYENDYGRRAVSKTKTYSLIGKPVSLNYKVEGVNYKDFFIPLISL